jgi:Helix-turn-helix domain
MSRYVPLFPVMSRYVPVCPEMPDRPPRGESPELFLTDVEVAEMLHRSVKTLRNDRSLRRGIPYVKNGRQVRYRLADVLAYMNDRIRAGGGTIVALLAGLIDWIELFGVG